VPQQNTDETINTEETNTDNLSPSMDDPNLPITGICLISKPTNVPTGYQCIRKGKINFQQNLHNLLYLAFDESSRDADLMADSIIERKDRFLCITRVYPLAGNKTLVLEDIKLVNERETPTEPYIALTQTMDTYEKGTAKRTICVKMIERQAGMKCITDIIFLYRSKRPPQFYTLIGDINGLQMCVKEGTVPPLRRTAPPPPNPTDNHQNDTPTDYPNANTHSKKSDEKEFLDGVPFEINAKYLNSNRNASNDPLGIDSFRILSRYEIEQYFHYDFNFERSHYNI
jgi:ESCRT-I complex subunit MVB12